MRHPSLLGLRTLPRFRSERPEFPSGCLDCLTLYNLLTTEPQFLPPEEEEEELTSPVSQEPERKSAELSDQGKATADEEKKTKGRKRKTKSSSRIDVSGGCKEKTGSWAPSVGFTHGRTLHLETLQRMLAAFLRRVS